MRKIVFDPAHRFATYVDWQTNYMDRSGWLIPDTEIWVGADRVIKINSLGCKGEELQPDVPVIAFFGDSATFGVGHDGWPAHVKVPGFQTLNCAIEGIDMRRCLARFLTLQPQVDLRCAVVFTGWHNIIYNETDEAFWASILSRFAGDHLLVLCNLPTCLTDECRDRGVEELLSDGRDGRAPFNFWCEIPPSRENVVKVLDGVNRYNAFLAEHCRREAVPLIDLAAFLRPASYAAVTADFFDVCHFRPETYARIGAFVAEALGPVLLRYCAANADRRPFRARRPEDAPAEDLRRNLYPLW